MLLWFITPVPLAGWQEMLMLLPLCLAVAIVRRLTRIDSIRESFLPILVTWGSYVIGMVALGIGLYLLQMIMV